MYATIIAVEYFNTTVKDKPGSAYQLLCDLFSDKVNLLAFSVTPCGPEFAQVVLFPENTERLIAAASKRDLHLVGPQRAFLIQGDDQLGALVEIHKKLYDAEINIYTSSGVTDGRGGYGYTLYVKPDDFQRAAKVLGV
ncbi:MAG: hypothetical protein PVF43_05820 [Candidatus Eiseniibacteriota bacterium]|jgi:hypothetical protein